METYKSTGRDRGNNTGIAVYTIALPDYKIINIEAMLYCLDHFVPDDDSIYSNKMYDRCELLSKIIYEILNIYNPLAVAYESAFLNSKYANAVIQLTQYTATLDRTIRYYDTFTKIFHYAPMMIKKKVGAGGGANKNDMLDNAKTIPILKEKLKLEELSEHEIDAASIGYVLYNDILTQPWLLYVI